MMKLFIKKLLFDNFITNHRVKVLLTRESWSVKQYEEYRDNCLYECLLTSKRRLPGYRQLQLPSNSNGILNFFHDNIPVISKSDLLKNADKYYPSKRLTDSIGMTSGTTGTPLKIIRSLDSTIWEKAFVKKHWLQHSAKIRRVTLRGDRVVPREQSMPPFWKYKQDQMIVSSLHLTDCCVMSIINEMKKFSATHLQAYPSTAFQLAKYLDAKGERLSIPYVFTGSEMLFPYQRELIERNIGKVIDFYGMAERVAMATECLHGNLHVNTDYSYVEILDENNLPTDDEGFIVGTTFHNHSMPLLRYKLSDRTKWKKGQCECGSSYPMIEPISGKFEDAIFDSEGSPISPSLITFAFKGVSNVKCSQVAQTDKDIWEVRLVPGENYVSKDGEKISNNLKQLVSHSTKIIIKLVDDIPRTASGKFRWVVNEIGRG